MLTFLKTLAARTADQYSMRACPWEPFRRPSLAKTAKTLHDREAECFTDLTDFQRFNELLLHRIPLPVGSPLDLGDQAIWQGIYLAALSFKYSRVRSDNLAQLSAQLLSGVYQHQWIHGEPKARLVRGYDRSRNNAWQDDASNDSLTGHFAGLYFCLKYGPGDLRLKTVSLLAGIAQELIEHDLQLVNANGLPTTHGKLIDGALTDPLQMTLVLAILTVAEHYGLHGEAGKYRDQVYTRYGLMIPYPKMVLGTWENWNDDHRAALHLCILALEDKSPKMQALVRAGLLRLWTLCRERANPWVNALIALGLGDTRPMGMETEMRRQADIVLSEYELEDKRWDTAVDWTGNLNATGHVFSGREIVGLTGNRWTPTIITIDNQPRARQPLPAWACGKQDFLWQRHRYSCRDWLGQQTPSQRFNGMDYIAAYWASVVTGLISEQA